MSGASSLQESAADWAWLSHRDWNTHQEEHDHNIICCLCKEMHECCVVCTSVFQITIYLVFWFQNLVFQNVGFRDIAQRMRLIQDRKKALKSCFPDDVNMAETKDLTYFTFNIKETGLTLTLRGEFPVLASIKDGYQQNRSQDIQTSSQNFTLGFHECYSWHVMMAQFSKRSRAAVVLYF